LSDPWIGPSAFGKCVGLIRSVNIATQFLQPQEIESCLYLASLLSLVNSIACCFYTEITSVQLHLSSAATSLIQVILTAPLGHCTHLLTVFLLSYPSVAHFPPKNQIHLCRCKADLITPLLKLPSTVPWYLE
jgi:hypothetical protein